MEKFYFDGFDSNGKPTRKKVLICPHQFKECKYQGFYGEGAFLICRDENKIKENKCFN